MAQTVRIRNAAAVLLVGIALVGPVLGSTDALAQGAAPAGSQSQGQTATGSMVEGKIVNVSGAKVTLDNGTELMIPSSVKVQRADLKPGATVKASFEERGGQKVVTAIAVDSAK
jgi:Cu/Ag efflux protein CusF